MNIPKIITTRKTREATMIRWGQVQKHKGNMVPGQYVLSRGAFGLVAQVVLSNGYLSAKYSYLLD